MATTEETQYTDLIKHILETGSTRNDAIFSQEWPNADSHHQKNGMEDVFPRTPVFLKGANGYTDFGKTWVAYLVS